MRSPQLIVKKSVANLPLAAAAFPGDLCHDLNSVNQMEGAATSGIWRSLGEGAPFDVAAYPFNEWKYMLEGEIRLVQDGETVSAFKGDTLYIPKGAKFTVVPQKFLAFFVAGREAETMMAKM